MHLRLSPPRGHRLRPSLLWLAACLALFAAAGCQPPAESAPEVDLKWSVSPNPPRPGQATVSLTLSDTAAGRPVEGAAVRLEANMSHPGMKPVLGTAREVAPGRYEAAIEFSMAGDWFLLVDAELRDGRTLHREVQLPGVRTR